MTRRVLKWCCEVPKECTIPECVDGLWYFKVNRCKGSGFFPGSGIPCPYGQSRDRLWVKETFRLAHETSEKPKVIYRADNEETWGARWKSSRFMFRKHSRITLEITGVRVERVRDITPDDCRAEGMPEKNNDLGVRYCFGQLWNQINEKRGYGWDTNCWVWVISFKRIQP